MLEISRYNNNDWLKPIGIEAETIFKQLDIDSAVAAASAVLTDLESPDIDIPWVVSFPSDGIQAVVGKLSTALKTPDNQTPFFNLDLQKPISQIKKLLGKNGLVEGFTALHAAYYLTTVAAEQPGVTFTLYKDKARKWPQFANQWQEQLTKQFGGAEVARALEVNSELKQILNNTAKAADAFDKSAGSLLEEGEQIPGYLNRVFASFEMFSDIDLGAEDGSGLRKAAEIMSRRQLPYKQVAYAIRGLTIPN